MQNGYRGNQSFRTSSRQSSFDRLSAAAAQRQEQARETSRWKQFFAYGQSLPKSYRKLLSRVAVCLVLVLGILVLKATESVPTGENIGTSQLDWVQEQELGRLQFVNSAQPLAYSLPLEGEVLQTFAESDKEVSIKGTARAEVKAILDGTVIQTMPDSVVINNANGTQTTYTGVQPQVLAGDTVCSAQVIGCLCEEVLYLETVSGIGYVDSLDAVQLQQAAMQIEG